MNDFKLSMLMDLYELTMANGYIAEDVSRETACFDMFFRKVPDNGGFAIMAGLEQFIEFVKNLKFDDEDIEFLRSMGIFTKEFLDYLKNFRFSCDIWAVPEGTPIFPNEPIIVVKGPIIEAQLIETMLLLSVNHQSLIATKANRIVRAAQGRPIAEFGARRAQGEAAAVYGARAAYIGGCGSTSCVLAGEKFGIPLSGTMAHSWVQLFSSEYEAFSSYARTYPEDCILLIDTYNTLKSGLPNALKVNEEILRPLGHTLKGVRIDSGDLAYLSKKIRAELDEAGLQGCKIIASSALDEYIIRDMLIQEAKIDAFGVGERLITAQSDAVFGGIYKLTAVLRSGEWIPKIKISENVTKITTPGFKMLYRLFERDTNHAIADLVTLHDEKIDDSKPYTIFDPQFTWKKKHITNFYAKPLLERIFAGGKCVYECPNVHEIREFCAEQIDTLWDEVKRFENPHEYYVDLSLNLWEMKQEMLAGEHS